MCVPPGAPTLINCGYRLFAGSFLTQGDVRQRNRARSSIRHHTRSCHVQDPAIAKRRIIQWPLWSKDCIDDSAVLACQRLSGNRLLLAMSVWFAIFVGALGAADNNTTYPAPECSGIT